MLKSILLCVTVFCSAMTYSQTYKSFLQTKWESKPKTIDASNTISIKENQIIISDFFNGGTEALTMDIDSLVVKDYNFKECKWYYCHSERKDILIVPNTDRAKDFTLFEFADDVTVFQYDFSCK